VPKPPCFGHPHFEGETLNPFGGFSLRQDPLHDKKPLTDQKEKSFREGWDRYNTPFTMTKNVKLFTVEEANQLLPILTPILQSMIVLRTSIDQLEVEIDALELILGGNSKEGKVNQELEAKISELNEQIGALNSAIHKIESTGCVLKGIEMGLVDFLSEREDRKIYLCWRLGEPRVSHWHEVSEGFSNRQPLV